MKQLTSARSPSSAFVSEKKTATSTTPPERDESGLENDEYSYPMNIKALNAILARKGIRSFDVMSGESASFAINKRA